MAALTLWPVIDEHGYHLVARRFGNGREADWPFFSSHLLRAGIAQPGPEADTLAFHSHWRGVLERRLDSLGGEDSLRSELLDAWMVAPDAHLVSAIATWARDLARWDVMERVWLLLGERTAGVPRDALEVLRDLPAEARKARPILTWGSGAAESALATTPKREAEAVLQRVLLDSALMHSDWSLREDTDEAVSAGSFRMLGERRLPSARPGQSLEAAWRTKQEVDAFIDARSRAGRGPGRTPQAIFRVFSARLALHRFDPATAITEARWATILADWEPVATAAAGVQALALSILAEDGSGYRADPPVQAIDDDLGPRGLRGQGLVFEILADAHEAVRRLDRDALDRCLALVTPEAAALVGVWAIRVSLEGWRAALWGDPRGGVDLLSEQIARLSVLSREQDEPLGGAFLARTRVLLLTKAGAFAAASQAAEAMPERLRLAPLARVHLWAGQYRQAGRLADAGPYQPGLDIAERYRLAMIRVSAAVLDGNVDENLRSDAVRELKRQLSTETFLPLALIPRSARDAVLELCRAHLDPSDPRLTQLTERLAQLNDAGHSGGSRPLHLTDREQVLLPLLATEDSVPDIARKLHVSVNTVRKQVVTLREKFQAESRAELVRKATAYGAIP